MKKTPNSALRYRTIPDVRTWIHLYTCHISAGDILKFTGTREIQCIRHAQKLAIWIIQYLTWLFFPEKKQLESQKRALQVQFKWTKHAIRTMHNLKIPNKYKSEFSPNTIKSYVQRYLRRSSWQKDAGGKTDIKRNISVWRHINSWMKSLKSTMKTTKSHWQKVQWKQKSTLTGNLIAQNFRTHQNCNLSSHKKPSEVNQPEKQVHFYVRTALDMQEQSSIGVSSRSNTNTTVDKQTDETGMTEWLFYYPSNKYFK